MFVQRFQVRVAALIGLEAQFFELRNCKFQELLDLSQPSIARLLRGFSDSFEKPLPIRVIFESRSTELVSIPKQLWHQVEIRCTAEERGELTKLRIRLDLLQM